MSLGKAKPPTKQSRAKGSTNTADDDNALTKDYVTGVGGGRVVTVEPTIERGPRVIALAPNPWERQAVAGTAPASARAAPRATQRTAGSSVSPSAPTTNEGNLATLSSKGKSLDQLAAEAIARESRAVGASGGSLGLGSGVDPHGLGLDSSRVIGMADAGAMGNGLASGVEGVGGQNGKKAPLLAQSMIPGLAEVDGDDAKFRHDLGHRAEDLSARSKAYTDVPVNEFGAALLRGMGWKGPTGDEDAGAGGVKDVEPRHHRLGLGAQPKPPEEVRYPLHYG